VPPLIHLSVLERLAHGTGDYAPGQYRAGGEGRDHACGRPRRRRTRARGGRAPAEAVLHSAHLGRLSLLSRVKTETLIGRAAYYIYLVSCTLVLLAACAPNAVGLLRLHPAAFWASAKRLATSPVLLFLSGRRIAPVLHDGGVLGPPDEMIFSGVLA